MSNEATRFKPGVSGNPKGKQRGEIRFDVLLRKALKAKLTAEDGKTITAAEAIVLKTVKGAIEGDTRCVKIVFDRAWGAVPQSTVVQLSGSAVAIQYGALTEKQKAAVIAANEALAEGDE